MTKKLCLAFALFACLLILASGAYAQPICIGVQVNGGAVTNEGCVDGTNSLPSADAAVGGGFTVTSLSGTGAPIILEPDILSNAIAISGSTAGVLALYITAENEFPSGPEIQSTFTSNDLNGDITSVVESTYVSQSNTAFALTSLLSTVTFTTTGTSTKTAATPASLSGPYSETTEYIITTTGVGNVNDTIDTVLVPEPASIALLGTGLLGLAGFARRRFLK